MAKKALTLNAEQQKVFSSFVHGANIFLCGKGGSGKSYLTKYIIDYCNQKGLSSIICAPTGIAALNIGGSTIHRTFRVPFGIVEPNTRCYDKNKLETLAKADVIIIDEISMCRIDVFEYVANTLLYVKPAKQLLVVGDFYQLPPVLRTEDGPAYSQLYGNKIFAFESELWHKLQLQTMELQTSMRQKDKAFVSALDNIRSGIPDFNIFPTNKPADPTALTICGTNKEADDINKTHLDRLKKDGAKLIKLKATVTGIVEPSEKPTDEELNLCPGAKVVMLCNDSDNRWVNGSFGEIASVSSDILYIRIEGKAGGAVGVERHKWSCLDYEVTKTENGTKLSQIERGSFEQFPVRLAWAITIHKSQGQTYERVNVNTSNIFAEGQLYVALSRCRSLNGMQILGSLDESKIKTSDSVIRFMSDNHRPELTGPMLPFYDDEELSPTDDRYQEGYDDGYRDGTEDTTAKYQQMVDKDPGVKVLSKYTKRQKELAQIEDPEIRNPKGAGRKKLPVNEKKSSKAIRVPGELADVLKQIGDLAKDNPDRIDQLKQQCLAIIQTY